MEEKAETMRNEEDMAKEKEYIEEDELAQSEEEEDELNYAEEGQQGDDYAEERARDEANAEAEAQAKYESDMAGQAEAEAQAHNEQQNDLTSSDEAFRNPEELINAKKNIEETKLTNKEAEYLFKLIYEDEKKSVYTTEEWKWRDDLKIKLQNIAFRK